MCEQNTIPHTLDGVLFANVTVTWQGWTTTLAKLYEAGWEIATKNRYSKYARTASTKYTGMYVYLKHVKQCMVARLSVDRDDVRDENNPDAFIMLYYELDFMVNRKLLHQTPVRTAYKGLDRGDIGDLLLVIQHLQSEYPQYEREPLPEAEVIEFMEFLKVA